ncbi:MAG: beta-L-arabinofuranosidase domain-containing protein, partial [Gemmatimonadales bacterium]
TLWNGILGSQHPADGQKLYYVSLAPGLWKLFGTPFHDYWCCTGTMSESFSKLGDSIYFHDDSGVYVNLFIASALDWKERGVHLVQETAFPEPGATTFTVHAEKPASFALRLRVPAWATGANRATLNGKPLEGFALAGGYYVIDRTWKEGDKLAVTLPMSLHLDPMPDDPTVAAVMYGPLVLAGRLGTAGLTPATLRAGPTKPGTVPEHTLPPVPAPAFKGSSDDPTQWIKPGTAPLEFTTVGQTTDVTFTPFHRIFDERYAIYWKITPA